MQNLSVYCRKSASSIFLCIHSHHVLLFLQFLDLLKHISSCPWSQPDIVVPVPLHPPAPFGKSAEQQMAISIAHIEASLMRFVPTDKHTIQEIFATLDSVGKQVHLMSHWLQKIEDSHLTICNFMQELEDQTKGRAKRIIRGKRAVSQDKKNKQK